MNRKARRSARHEGQAAEPALEPALDFAALEAAGEGSRWTIIRRIDRGDFPQPDFYVGRYPRWLTSTVQRRRDELIAAHRAGAQRHAEG